ncbi:MAG TPA: hypothetical protein VGL06_03615 [Pseudonocardiaceae bacterium]
MHELATMTEQATDFFHDATASALTREDVATGTMMGFPCLRVSGAFFASCDHRTGDLIVKLPRQRVQELITAGNGKPFAPAGRTFREWVLIDNRDPARWAALIDEARTYVGGQP